MPTPGPLSCWRCTCRCTSYTSVVPFFVSTMRRAKLMGGVLVLALIATFIIERQALTSVWCFFAAILSGFMVFGLDEQRRLTP
jgi:hypothetical protein